MLSFSSMWKSGLFFEVTTRMRPLGAGVAVTYPKVLLPGTSRRQLHENHRGEARRLKAPQWGTH
jgi:hypothetical protein